MKKLLHPSLNHNFLVFLVVVLLCYAYSSFVRYEQYKVWEEKAAQYFADQTPMMTTLDSYFWLRWAREYNDGGIPKGRDQLRNFPDGKRLQHPVPMISYLIAKVAPSFDNNYYRAGLFLMIGLSGAFIFPLALYFRFIGYPIAGIFGGLFGTVSYEYFIRTGIGRVDTDALMLFFPFLIAVFVLQAAQARKFLHILIYACLGGGVTYLLTLWWGKSVYVLPVSAVLFLTLFLHRISQTQITRNEAKHALLIKQKLLLDALVIGLIASAMFFVCAIGFKFSDLSRIDFSDTLIRYLGEYIQPKDQINLSETSSIAFPNVLQTITEAKQFPIQKSLSRLLTSPTLSAIGLIGFLMFFLTHWKRLLPILPIFVTGLLTFQGARRFGMFLGPFVGIGYGFLLTVFTAWLFQRARAGFAERYKIATLRPVFAVAHMSQAMWDRVKEITIYGIAAVFFLSVLSSTAVGRIPKPSIAVPIFRTFVDLKRILPTNSTIYTWWDYGYALTEITNQATFHDGGSQTSPKTYFIARSFMSDDPKELYNTISYLATEGARGIYRMIEENPPNEELLSNILVTPPALHNENVFVVYTRDLIKKYRTISSIGGWDVERKRFGQRTGYDILTCDRLEEDQIRCREGTIDLTTGLATSGAAIKEAVIVDSGHVKRRITYSNDHGSYLQILTNGQTLVGAHIVGEAVYKSNFNQMYLLGQYDSDLFDEYYNSFPWTRVFHVNTLTRSDNPPGFPSN